MAIEGKDILQVDATVIAGILILLTISSIAGETSNIKDLIGFVSLTLIPFVLSAMVILIPVMRSISPRRERTLLEASAALTIGGFFYLTILLVNFFFFLNF